MIRTFSASSKSATLATDSTRTFEPKTWKSEKQKCFTIGISGIFDSNKA